MALQSRVQGEMCVKTIEKSMIKVRQARHLNILTMVYSRFVRPALLPNGWRWLTTTIVPQDARRGRRVHQEVAALRRLDHPNIIVLYDVIQTRDNIHIISERMERDLFEYIHRRPAISESETFVIIFQIIQAVMFCHTQGSTLCTPQRKAWVPTKVMVRWMMWWLQVLLIEISSLRMSSLTQKGRRPLW